MSADEYLTQVSRYIHLNPVKAKMAESPQNYAWSSYRFFAGEKDAPEWLEVSLLTHFSRQRKKAIQNYRDFVKGANADTLENSNDRSVGGCILGGTSFIDWVQVTLWVDKGNVKNIQQLKRLRLAIPPGKIVETVAAATDSSSDMIVVMGKKRNRPREMAIYLAQRFCTLSCAELGHFFGGISGAAISLCGKRFAAKMENNPAQQGVIDEIQSRMLDS